MSVAEGPALAVVALALLRAFGQGSFPLSLTGGYAAGLVAFAALGVACAATALRLSTPRGQTAGA